jgi:hypothetical protein
MAARFAVPGSGATGYRVEAIDGSVLGRVRSVGGPDADLLVETGERATAGTLTWRDVVWVDPRRRTLLVTRTGAEKLAVRNADAPVDDPRPARLRPGAAIATVALGLTGILVAVLDATLSRSPSATQTILGIASGAVLAVGAVLVWRRPRRPPPHPLPARPLPPLPRKTGQSMLGNTLMSLVAAVAAGCLVAPAFATAPPVGQLPAGPTKAVTAAANGTFVITLPKSKQPGLVWRIARNYRSSIVHQLTEGETKGSVWVRFASVRPGKTSLVFALTRGERSHAFAARTFVVTVR